MAEKQLGRLAVVNRGEAATRALTAVAELNRAGALTPVTTVAECERIYATPRSRRLGYDLEAGALHAAATGQRRLGESAPPDDTALPRCEDGLPGLIADLCSLLHQPKTEPQRDGEHSAGLSGEHLVSYLQRLDADRAALPDHYRQSLERVLRRYGLPGLEQTPRLEAAVVWLLRALQRVGEILVPAVACILERRLRHGEEYGRLADAQSRALLGRLAAAGQGRYQDLADLAHAVRFHCPRDAGADVAETAESAEPVEPAESAEPAEPAEPDAQRTTAVPRGSPSTGPRRSP